MTSTKHHRIAQLLTAAALSLTALGGLAILTYTPSTPTPQPVAQAGPVMGCWTEWKQDGTTERLYGDTALAPAGSTPLDCAAFSEPVDPADGAEQGAVEEDSPDWDCRTMGNRVCGDGATVVGQVVPAGDYSDGDQVAAPVGPCLAGLGYSAGPVVRADAEWCAQA